MHSSTHTPVTLTPGKGGRYSSLGDWLVNKGEISRRIGDEKYDYAYGPKEECDEKETEDEGVMSH